MTYPENIRAAFREVALGLMEWEPPAGDEPREILRPRGKQETPEYVEPFDVDADWEERA